MVATTKVRTKQTVAVRSAITFGIMIVSAAVVIGSFLMSIIMALR